MQQTTGQGSPHLLSSWNWTSASPNTKPTSTVPSDQYGCGMRWGSGGGAGMLSAPSRGLTHPAWDLYTGVLRTLKTPATFKRISRHILCRLNLPFRRTNKCASISGACKFHSGPNGTLSSFVFFFFPGKRTRGACIVLIASSHFPLLPFFIVAYRNGRDYSPLPLCMKF